MSLFLYFLVFVLGASVGSFLNVLVFRTREGVSLFTPRSFCPACRRSILWRDNVPVIGFLLLGGKCRFCRAAISRHYPMVEAAVGSAFLLAAVFHGASFVMIPAALLGDWFIIADLAAVFLYDLRYGEIPDRLTLLPALAIFLASFGFGWRSLSDMLFGAAVGSGFFLLQYLVSRGKWIGGGDIRLGIFMGAVLGWPGILVGLFVSYLIGAVASLLLLAVRKKQFGDAVPFGTFLAIGTGVAVFWGGDILAWYMNLLQ